MAVALACALAPAGSAWACPVCISETGRQVRAEIFADDFGWNLLQAALPFAGVSALLALFHLSLLRSDARARDEVGR